MNSKILIIIILSTIGNQCIGQGSMTKNGVEVDPSDELGERYLVSSFYKKIKTQSGAVNSQGEEVAEGYFTPADVQIESTQHVDIYEVSAGLYKIKNYDLYMGFPEPPQKNSGILFHHESNIIYQEKTGNLIKQGCLNANPGGL